MPLSVLLPAAKMSVSKPECAPPSSVIPVPVTLTCTSVERLDIGRSEVEPIIARAEVDGDAGRSAPRREGHSISTSQGHDIAAAHTAHNGDTICGRDSQTTKDNVGLDSGVPRAAGDRSSSIDYNTRPVSCPCENTDSGTRRDRIGRNSRRSTAIIADRDASEASYDRAACDDGNIAGRAATVEPYNNASAGKTSSSDGGASDSDCARSGSGILGSDASGTSTHHGPAACVDSDSRVGAIGLHIYPATVDTAAGDIADCVLAGAVDYDIATSATSATTCIGVDATSDSAG